MLGVNQFRTIALEFAENFGRGGVRTSARNLINPLRAVDGSALVDNRIVPVAVQDITGLTTSSRLLPPATQPIALLPPAKTYRFSNANPTAAMTDVPTRISPKKHPFATAGTRAPQPYRLAKNSEGELESVVLRQPQPYIHSNARGWPPGYDLANKSNPVFGNATITDAVASSTASPSWFARAQAGEAAQAVRTATATASKTVGQAVAGAGKGLGNAGRRAAEGIQETGRGLVRAIEAHPVGATVAAGSVGVVAGTGMGLAIADESQRI
jgi:hypothetical protein